MTAAILWLTLALAGPGPDMVGTDGRLSWLATPEAADPVRFAEGDSVWLDSVLRAEISRDTIPGMATIVIKDGRIAWNSCYGYAILAESIPVTDTTCFTVASVSKTITGIALMQLWEHGFFDLDSSINESLPFTVRHSRYPDSLIAYRMLMTHTSGLRDEWSTIHALTAPGDPVVSLREFTEGYFVPGGAYYDSAANFQPWVPGNRWAYSNAGIALLASIIEAMADSFPIQTRNSIFHRLGMTRSTWFFRDLDTMSVACQYRRSGPGYHRYGYLSNPFFPAGMLKTCTRDYARFLTAIMQYGRYDTVRILDSATVALMTRPHIQNPKPWGLIWYTDIVNGDTVWCHSGGWLGVNTYVGFRRRDNAGIIAFTNGHNTQSWPGLRGRVVPALFRFADQVGLEEGPVPSIALPGPAATFAQGVLLLQGRAPAILLDITGRKIAELHPGPNDIRHLSPGVYFVCPAPGVKRNASSVHKVIIGR